MSDIDVFGNVIDSGTVEAAALSTLQAWLPAHLAHQERRNPDFAATLPDGHLPQPRSWPVISEFDIQVHDQMPAVFVMSPGTAGAPIRDQSGAYRTAWRIEVGVAIAGNNERQARDLAGLYLAAIKGAMVQNKTLGGVAAVTVLVGPDDHVLGTTPRGDQRALYGTAFEVTVRDVVNDQLGPPDPPDDPYNPDPPAESPLEAEILITAMEEETP